MSGERRRCSTRLLGRGGARWSATVPWPTRDAVDAVSTRRRSVHVAAGSDTAGLRETTDCASGSGVEVSERALAVPTAVLRAARTVACSGGGSAPVRALTPSAWWLACGTKRDTGPSASCSRPRVRCRVRRPGHRGSRDFRRRGP